MGRLLLSDCNVKDLSPLTLAFVGDGVYDLIVREELVCIENRPVGELNKMKVEKVRCQSQAKLIKILEPLLTQEETDMYKRGRNAHPSHMPKNASSADYHMATGFETLLGFLYLSDRIERIRELMEKTKEYE